jgi:hypothetical protein
MLSKEWLVEIADLTHLIIKEENPKNKKDTTIILPFVVLFIVYILNIFINY